MSASWPFNSWLVSEYRNNTTLLFDVLQESLHGALLHLLESGTRTAGWYRMCAIRPWYSTKKKHPLACTHSLLFLACQMMCGLIQPSALMPTFSFAVSAKFYSISVHSYTVISCVYSYSTKQRARNVSCSNWPQCRITSGLQWPVCRDTFLSHSWCNVCVCSYQRLQNNTHNNNQNTQHTRDNTGNDSGGFNSSDVFTLQLATPPESSDYNNNVI